MSKETLTNEKVGEIEIVVLDLVDESFDKPQGNITDETINDYISEIDIRKIDGGNYYFSNDKCIGILEGNTFYATNYFSTKIIKKYFTEQYRIDRRNIVKKKIYECDALGLYILGEVEKDKREETLQDAIVMALEREEWNVGKEHVTDVGIIDVFAEKDNRLWVFEVKKDSTLFSCRTALGQLLFYKNAYPKAKLWFASPKAPKERIIQILLDNNVSYFDLMGFIQN
jgi:hypothetical protein